MKTIEKKTVEQPAELTQAVRQYAMRSEIRPDPNQPRTDFPEKAQAELRDSIQVEGIHDCLIVRKDPDGKVKWMIIEGERRWRVCGDLKIERLPIEVREMSEEAVRKYQRIVGTQRLNLSALEEARSLQAELERRQKDNPEFSKSDLATAVGRGRTMTYELLSLLSLQPAVSRALKEGKLTPTHAVRIAVVPSEDGQMKLLKEIEEGARYGEGVSVKDLEYSIARDHCKNLKDAPFDLKNGEMFKHVQMVRGSWFLSGVALGEEIALVSCAACPHRSGNLPNWPDQKNPNMCLKPACYRAKVLAAAVANGQKVLSGEEYKKQSDKYVRSTESRNWGNGSSYNYQSAAQAMGKHAPKPTVTVDDRGEVVQVFLKEDTRAAMVKAGIKFEKPKPSNPAASAKAKEEEKAAEETQERREKLVLAQCPMLIRCLAILKDAVAWEIGAEIGKTGSDYPHDLLEEHLIQKAKTPKVVVLSRLFADEEWYPVDCRGDWDLPAVKMWKRAGVDLVALDKKAVAAAKKNSPAKTGGGAKDKPKGKKK